MHSYPGMVAIVTATYDGVDNVMAAGWHSYISFDPPIYGVAVGQERFTYSLIKQSQQFAINFLPLEKAEFIQQAGVYTGKSTNKFHLGNMEFDRGITIDAPILRDSYIAYECQTIDVNTYGDHDWFVGEITQFYRDDQLFGNDGLPNDDQLNIPLYLGRSTYTTTADRQQIRIDQDK